MNKSLILVAIFLFSCGSSNNKNKSALVLHMDSLRIAEKRKQDPVFKRGEEVYKLYCIACHMNEGEGVEGLHPPLQRTKQALGDKNVFIEYVIEGMEGEIKVSGKTYNNVMAPLGFLSDEDIAAVVTYVRQSFGNDAEGVLPEEVAAVRKRLMGT